MKKIAIFCLLLLLGACTTVQVTPIDNSVSGGIACIEENPKVKVPRFLEIVSNGFEENGFVTRIYQGTPHTNCELLVKYTATRSWDFTPYMTDAEVWVRDRNGNRVGYGQYHLKAGGGFALNKWASAESKMKKVFEQLFQNKQPNKLIKRTENASALN